MKHSAQTALSFVGQCVSSRRQSTIMIQPLRPNRLPALAFGAALLYANLDVDRDTPMAVFLLVSVVHCKPA